MISFSEEKSGKTSLPSIACLSPSTLFLSVSLVAAGLIGGFVTPALTGRAELRSQRFGNYPLTQQPTAAQMHSHTHTHTWPACQYVRDGETGCLCFPSPSLSPSLHICVSLSLISRVRFSEEEGVRLRRFLTFNSNIQSVLSQAGPELTLTHTRLHTHRNPGRSEGLLFFLLSSIGPVDRLADGLSSLVNVQQLVKHRK